MRRLFSDLYKSFSVCISLSSWLVVLCSSHNLAWVSCNVCSFCLVSLRVDCRCVLCSSRNLFWSRATVRSPAPESLCTIDRIDKIRDVHRWTNKHQYPTLITRQFSDYRIKCQGNCQHSSIMMRKVKLKMSRSKLLSTMDGQDSRWPLRRTLCDFSVSITELKNME